MRSSSDHCRLDLNDPICAFIWKVGSALKGVSTGCLESLGFLEASELHAHLSTMIYLQIQRCSLIGLFDDFAMNPIGFVEASKLLSQS